MTEPAFRNPDPRGVMRYILALSIPLLLFAATAQAEEAERLRAAADPLVRQECGACHMAYRARWLSAESWRKIMADLENHFGEDASLDPKTRERITAYLVANAGKPSRQGARITETRWWKRRHRKIATAQWTRAGAPANCGACHEIRTGKSRKKKGFFERLFEDDDEDES